MVIGAPSPANHLKEFEVQRAKAIAGDKLVLMPGVGAQGGEAQSIISTFGWENVIANVGRAIMYAHNPAREAQKYKEMLNGFK
ncbi:orotidine 5'-phosphate decarboxylase [Candidatus Woesearchaeota archaeon]|nr:orotidine 5'-phosphate decarboxylase [Candidatus Woesearchaeota archaeon]